MNEPLNDICSYIDFLEEKQILVRLSYFGERYNDCINTLLKYEIHPCAICHYMKSNKYVSGKCIENKRKLNMKNQRNCCYGSCYAGIEEYIFPVLYDNDVIMRIHLTGFRGKTEESKNKRNKYSNLLGRDFDYLYDKLNTEIPSAEDALHYIKPLFYMIKDLYKNSLKNQDSDNDERKIYKNILIFIYNNYTNIADCNDIANELNYSESYIRMVFKKNHGISIGRFINDLKMEKAQQLLKSTANTITEISGLCGYEDSNYFSFAFKKKYGLSPIKYRQNCNKTNIKLN